MKRTHLIAVLVGLVTMSIFATDASAYYHPGMGIFMSRDPGAGGAGPARIGTAQSAVGSGFVPRDPTGQYPDGVNLYQYLQNNPVNYVDPSGLFSVGEHNRITDTAFGEMYTGRTLNARCRKTILNLLHDVHSDIDKKQGQRDQYLHYNRPTSATSDARKLEADFQYGHHINQLSINITSKLWSLREYSLFDVKLWPLCKETLRLIGERDHSYQDFFRHAIRQIANESNNNGWTAFSVGIIGDPYNRGSFWPSSYPWEHPWWGDPNVGEKEETARHNKALEYQKMANNLSLYNWITHCWCRCNTN